MPETVTTILTIFSIFSYATITQNEEVDVYINDRKVAEYQQLTPQQKREQRRVEILNQALARREEIILANNRAISEKYLR